ncbi:MAG: hypothetical protein K9J80_11995 [Sulfuritalea sp.]|nr:hypothetical protein [Sulfuritalea sp.]
MTCSFIMRRAAVTGLPRPAEVGRFQRGQALVFALFTSVLVILALFAMYSMGGQVIEKIRLQNTADAAAYSAALAEARDYNFSAYTNRAMVANQVAVAQFVGLTSWFRNMSAFTNNNVGNVGRSVYEAFFAIPSPLGNFYKKFLKTFGKAMGIFDEGKGGTTFMKGAVTMLDGLILIYGETQRVYHYATALTVAETLGAFSTMGAALDNLLGVTLFTGPLTVLDGGAANNIILANDDKASLTIGSAPYLAYHYFKWFKFTEYKDPNTDGKDGANADRFAQVAMDSLDDFSRDRSTKPAWGFTFFYAPPLTFVDPTRFIPYQNGPLFLPVIHRGGTELKVTTPSGTGGNAGTGGGSGSSGVDCHGNPVTSSSAGTGGVSVDQYSQLSPFSATACDGDSARVNVGNASKPKGVYAFRAGTWIDPATLTNTQGNASTTTTAPANGSANPGAVGSKSKKNWTALDASSWSGLDLIWISILGIPIPLPIPFAPPWIPLSHGAAQSGKKLDPPTVLASNNNFGVTASEAYGSVLDSWTTKVSASMRQKTGAGASLDMSPKLGGITKYMDVKDVAAENLTGPALVIEIEKKASDTPQNPGTGQFSTENGASHGKMRSLSKAQTYFARPTNDSALAWFKRTTGTATQTELGSLYNPYWQARLLPNTFIEQYISMEMQRFGI